MREDKINTPVIKIQKLVRGWLVRVKYKKTVAASRIQRVAKGYLTRKKYENIKWAAIILQSTIRTLEERRKYLAVIDRVRVERREKKRYSQMEEEKQRQLEVVCK